MTRQDMDARFRALYERCSRSVFGYFLRMGFPREDVKELTQETFLRVYPHMKSIRGKTEGEEAAYVLAAAATVRANTLRAKNAQKRMADEVSLDALPKLPKESTEDLKTRVTPPNPEEELSRKQESTFQRKRLYRAIYELPPGTRCCLLLQLADLKYREIADAMGISLDAVKTRLYDARKRLTKKLGKELPWPHREEDNHD